MFKLSSFVWPRSANGLREAGVVLLYVALVSYFWWPSLWNEQLIIHADSAHLGLSLLQLLHGWLHGEVDSLLWSSGIYGGHPIFAESQGGFLNPLNLICAYFFEPEYGVGVLHWLDMLVAGLGVYTLCRVLNLNRWASLFAAVVSTYSSIWLGFQYNTSVAGAMAWLPWLLAAVQYWLKSPSLMRAMLMAIPATLLIFAGYPHIAHGAAIYLACYGLTCGLCMDGRRYLAANYKALVLSGALAVVIAILLSAVQLIPLIELLQQSNRRAGVSLPFGGLLSAESYISGLMFFDWSLAPVERIVGSLSSLAVFSLAVLCLCLRMPFTILAHAVAAFVLFNLGMEFASPIFSVIYKYHLIPGLHGYRIMHPFFVPAVIGISILAAYAVSALSRPRIYLAFRREAVNNASLVFAGFWLTLALSGIYFYPDSYSLLNYATVVAIGLSIFLLMHFKCFKAIPFTVASIVILDALIVRSDIFSFHDKEVVAEPDTVTMVRRDPGYEDYRSAVSNIAAAYVFIHPKDPSLAENYRRFLNGFSPFPSVVGGVPSINGTLALGMQRRDILNDVIDAEIGGAGDSPLGRRLIDILGVRYIASGHERTDPGFELLARNDAKDIYLYKNIYALPKFRFYSDVAFVNSPQEALSRISAGDSDALYIETNKPNDHEKVHCAAEAGAVSIAPEVRSSQRYVAAVDTPCAGWFYIADAYYPGWQAMLDGQKAELYPAGILGKALYLPAGQHHVEVFYRARSFHWGLIISGMGVIAFCCIILWSRYRGRIVE